MPVPALVTALVLLAAVVIAGRRPARGWGALAAWALAGFLSAFASISFAIGLLVLPFAVVAIAGAARVGVWPAVLGFVAGAGLLAVLVWALNVGEPGPGDSRWLAGGAALVLLSTTTFARLRTS